MSPLAVFGQCLRQIRTSFMKGDNGLWKPYVILESRSLISLAKISMLGVKLMRKEVTSLEGLLYVEELGIIDKIHI